MKHTNPCEDGRVKRSSFRVQRVDRAVKVSKPKATDNFWLNEHNPHYQATVWWRYFCIHNLMPSEAVASIKRGYTHPADDPVLIKKGRVPYIKWVDE